MQCKMFGVYMIYLMQAYARHPVLFFRKKVHFVMLGKYSFSLITSAFITEDISFRLSFKYYTAQKYQISNELNIDLINSKSTIVISTVLIRIKRKLNLIWVHAARFLYPCDNLYHNNMNFTCK